MIRNCLSLSLLVLLCLCSAACQAENPKVDMQEGLWEITTVMKMPGIPMQIPPTKTTQCISQEDLIPQTQQPDQPDQQCEIANMNTTGNTITYDMVCAGQGNIMKAHSSITYNKNQMQGSMMATMEPSNMSMTYTLTGKRIGDCSK
jgi:hypothetical protein